MTSSIIPFKLTGSGRGVKQDIEIDGSPLRFSAEGHRSLGGTDTAPSPLDYALGSLTSCTQVTARIVASQNSAIELGQWHISLEARFDSSVLVSGAAGVSNFRDVDLTIDVETNLSGRDFAEFTAEVERRCPVTQLFRGSGVTLNSKWSAVPLAALAEAGRKVA